MKATTVWIMIAGVLMGGLVSGETRAEQPEVKSRPADLEKVYALFESGDSYQVFELIESVGQPLEIAAAYHRLLRGIYSRKHDLPRMIMLGQMGIRYCLHEAARVGNDDARLAAQLKGMAKTIAYDLAANAWPGFNGPEVAITRSDLLAALDAARLNLRLTGELGRDADVVGNAHWLLGAQYLALGDHTQAIEQFFKSAAQFQQAGKAEYEQMALGYVGITKLAVDKSSVEGKKQLADAVDSLTQIGSDDAKFFARQIEHSAKVFVP